MRRTDLTDRPRAVATDAGKRDSALPLLIGVALYPFALLTVGALCFVSLPF